MSFFEDYVEDGLCCMCCGELIDGEEPGYPRECENCSPHRLKKKKGRTVKKDGKSKKKTNYKCNL